MPSNTTPDQVIADAQGILKVWTANPDFKLKDVTLEAFQTDTSHLADLVQQIADKEEAIKPLRNDRDDLMGRLNSVCTRARAGIKGYFGGNSSEYELAGGTRSSERQKSGPRAKPATPAKP